MIGLFVGLYSSYWVLGFGIHLAFGFGIRSLEAFFSLQSSSACSNYFYCSLITYFGRLTQRESAILTRWKSQVQILYRPPFNKMENHQVAASLRLVNPPEAGKASPGQVYLPQAGLCAYGAFKSCTAHHVLNLPIS
jgi:hypothetical protein